MSNCPTQRLCGLIYVGRKPNTRLGSSPQPGDIFWSNTFPSWMSLVVWSDVRHPVYVSILYAFCLLNKMTKLTWQQAALPQNSQSVGNSRRHPSQKCSFPWGILTLHQSMMRFQMVGCFSRIMNGSQHPKDAVILMCGTVVNYNKFV